MSENNGQLKSQDIQRKLDSELTVGYVPQLPITGMFGANGFPTFWLRQDIEQMLWHPTVVQALNYFKGGIAGAEFWGGPNPNDSEDEKGIPICATDERVSVFIKEQCERFWDKGVPWLQNGYDYGWIGAECVYETKQFMEWQKLEVFSPNDTYLLTCAHEPVGVRVKNVKDKPAIDLWMGDGSIPAKGLWYVHRPRYNRYYGQSQLLGAWRAWRRLASKDGAETVVDGAFYRFGYQGPKVRFPEEDYQGPSGSPYTTPDSEGNPRRFARDMARQIGEQYKAGATVGLPSTRDKNGNYLWELEIPTSTLAGINGLLDYLKALEDQITAGIGVPPELLEASETGSGYSGRRIPMEAFLDTQQQIADAMLTLFMEQVLKSLVRWNFGDVVWNVKVKRLIQTKAKASAKYAQGADGQQQKQPQQIGQQPPEQFQGQIQPQPPRMPAVFSNLLVTDTIREKARKVLQRVA